MKQVTAILIGGGQRGAQAYASYALQYPNELQFVGIAEPRADRREEFCKKHGIEENIVWRAGSRFWHFRDLQILL